MEYHSIYSRGFYLSKKKRTDDILSSWACFYVGGYVFQFHPKTSYYIVQSPAGNESIILVGLPVDLDDISARGQEIASKCACFLEYKGFESAQKYVAYLGGRFLAFIVKHDESLCVIPDCHATYACYYTEDNGGAFSSHINLLGKVEGLEVNERARIIINSPEYKSPGGKYYPALMLPYVNVLTLLPNCRIDNCVDSSKIDSKRFYPFLDIDFNHGESKDDLVYRFKSLLDLHISGIVKDRDFYVSLTGGLDSGVAFSSIIKNDHLKSKAKAFTYFNASSPSEGAIKDVMSASSRAFTYSIPHKVVDLKPLEIASQFHQMYTLSFQYGARFPSLARAYYEELPHDILSLVSTCSETGTVFYQKREISEITPEILAEKFSRSEVRKNKDVLESFSNYIEYADFNKEKLGPIDFYDAFYWEHRNAKWASLWYAEADLSHFTVVPFNQRDIIELMLSLPFEDRKDKEILKLSLAGY